MNWQTLLVPHDYSPSADLALAQAAELARLHGAKLVLLHVTHLPPGLTADAMIKDRDSGELVRVDAFAAAETKKQLDARAAPLRAEGIAVEVRSALGDVAERILEASVDMGADLVVIGTHGRTGIAHLFLGSMAEKVLRRSTVPVLTVREGQRRTTGEVVLPDLATD